VFDGLDGRRGMVGEFGVAGCMAGCLETCLHTSRSLYVALGWKELDEIQGSHM
jgi:hypothetical protein